MTVELMSLMNKPSEVLEKTIHVQERRASTGTLRMILLGILAGVFIAGGAAVSSVGAHAFTNVSVIRLVTGLVFPIGLMMIVFVGGELFTGNCLMILGVVDRRFKARHMFRALVVVFFSNLIGAMLVVVLIFFSGQYDFSSGLLGAYTIKVAYAKTSMTFLEGFCSGVMCNIFVCGAVFVAGAAKEEGGKIWAIFFTILAFVVGGLEHCIANMYYIPAGIMAMTNPEYLDLAKETYGYTAEQLANLNWGTFFTHNIIPVGLGNIVGGMALGVALYLVYKKLPATRKSIHQQLDNDID